MALHWARRTVCRDDNKGDDLGGYLLNVEDVDEVAVNGDVFCSFKLGSADDFPDCEVLTLNQQRVVIAPQDEVDDTSFLWLAWYITRTMN